MKRLYRSGTNKVFAGVIGGIGEYFDVDPVALRVVWVVVMVFTGFIPAVIAYTLAMIVIPKRAKSEPVIISSDSQ
ncbi:MAG: PspC domain-containing protein [bacterium]